MVLKINGVNITPYIAFGGLKWTRNDVESPNAGRTIDGIMHRERVSTKIRLDVTCRLLKANELRTVLNAIQPVTVSVEYDDPMLGRRTAQMYANNNSAAYCIKKPNGTEWWNGVSFPLIEI